MENQNHNLQSSLQHNQIAGKVDNAVEECQCVLFILCMRTDTWVCSECSRSDIKENDAALEGDAAEQSGVFEQSDVVEDPSIAMNARITELLKCSDFDVFEQYGEVEQSVVVEQSGVVQQSDCTEIYASRAVEEDDATEKSDAVHESISIAPEASIAIDIKETDATEEHLNIREHPCVGRYQLELTSSFRHWCGAFALVISTFSQLGMTMTLENFWQFYRSQEMQSLNQLKGYNNNNNFFDEQLALVLRLWGRQKGFGNVQLGVILEGAEFATILGDDNKFLLVSSEADMECERGFRTVWIHNDNAQHRSEAKLNHYSGITPLERSEVPQHGPQGEPEDSPEAKSSTEEGSVMKIGDYEERGRKRRRVISEITSRV